MSSHAGLALAIVLAGGCTICHAKPLNYAAVTPVLAPPDRMALAERAAALHHRALAPVTLDVSRPLTADQIAVVAVFTNPDLVALRAQAAVARASGSEPPANAPDPTSSPTGVPS